MRGVPIQNVFSFIRNRRVLRSVRSETRQCRREAARHFQRSHDPSTGHAAACLGNSGGGEKITVSFADQVVSTQADAQGKWSLKLNPLHADAQPREFVAGTNILTIEDVLVGESGSAPASLIWRCR